MVSTKAAGCCLGGGPGLPTWPRHRAPPFAGQPFETGDKGIGLAGGPVRELLADPLSQPPPDRGQAFALPGQDPSWPVGRRGRDGARATRRPGGGWRGGWFPRWPRSLPATCANAKRPAPDPAPCGPTSPHPPGLGPATAPHGDRVGPDRSQPPAPTRSDRQPPDRCPLWPHVTPPTQPRAGHGPTRRPRWPRSPTSHLRHRGRQGIGSQRASRRAP